MRHKEVNAKTPSQGLAQIYRRELWTSRDIWNDKNTNTHI